MIHKQQLEELSDHMEKSTVGMEYKEGYQAALNDVAEVVRRTTAEHKAATDAKQQQAKGAKK